jgi:glycogen operon protein
MTNDTTHKIRVWPGRPFPLGASWDGTGVNFSIFSENATKVKLCLFDTPESTNEHARIQVTETTDQIWHCYLQDAKPGQVYGYRIHGPHDPEKGHRFNHNKVVLDPYAKAICRYVKWSDEMFGYRIGDGREDLSFDERDNAAFAPLAVVIDNQFDWKEDRHPKIAWNQTIIYELHVKGFTYRNPHVPENLRGTYMGARV